MQKFFRIKRISGNQRGMGLLEMLVAIALLAAGSLALLRMSLLVTANKARVIRNTDALAIASEAIETMSSIDPENLDDNDDSVDTVTRDGIVYRRNINVTVNTDLSRTVDVAIEADNMTHGGQATLQATFTFWGTV